MGQTNGRLDYGDRTMTRSEYITSLTSITMTPVATVPLTQTRNVFKKKTGRRIIDGEFHYRLEEISYNSDRPNDILNNK